MKFVIGGIAGFAIGMLILKTLGAQSVHSTPAPCNNGGCMVPALIAFPIVAGLFGGIGTALGVAAGEAGLVVYGISQVGF
jgi:hypothetical protein